MRGMEEERVEMIKKLSEMGEGYRRKNQYVYRTQNSEV